jgi:hypothetical protein
MYEVTFEFPAVAAAKLKEQLQAAVGDRTSGSLTGDGLITLMCNEAQLPNISSLTGQTNGIVMGEGQVNYAYGRLYSDISLGWQCDHNMTPLRFLQVWHDYTFSDSRVGGGSPNAVRQTPSKVRYPEEYQGKIIITKLSQGKGTKDLKPMKYVLIDAFPFSIDATPLSYGSSQIVNVSASFYYSRYFVENTDVI